MTPREAFVKDLTLFILERQTEGHDILLAGDFNEALTDGSLSGMSELSSKCKLVDLMYVNHLNEDTEEFPTWISGRERIDYVLCSERVAEACLNCVYEPFHYRTKGDHRYMILDFCTTDLFGNNTQNIAIPMTRDLNSKDKANNRIFIEEKYKQLEQQNFKARVQLAFKRRSVRRMEGLKRDWDRSAKVAAHKCVRKKNTAYTRTLADLRTKKQVLTKLLKQFRTKLDMQESIAMKLEFGNKLIFPETEADCQQQLREVQKEITETEKQAKEKRKQELEAKERERLNKGDKAGAKAIRNIIKAEEKSKMWRKLRYVRGQDKTGLTSIMVPENEEETNYKDCTEWISIDTPDEIEKILMERNQKHFGQAKGTWPTKPPFSE